MNISHYKFHVRSIKLSYFKKTLILISSVCSTFAVFSQTVSLEVLEDELRSYAHKTEIRIPLKAQEKEFRPIWDLMKSFRFYTEAEYKVYSDWALSTAKVVRNRRFISSNGQYAITFKKTSMIVESKINGSIETFTYNFTNQEILRYDSDNGESVAWVRAKLVEDNWNFMFVPIIMVHIPKINFTGFAPKVIALTQEEIDASYYTPYFKKVRSDVDEIMESPKEISKNVSRLIFGLVQNAGIDSVDAHNPRFRANIISGFLNQRLGQNISSDEILKNEEKYAGTMVRILTGESTIEFERKIYEDEESNLNNPMSGDEGVSNESSTDKLIKKLIFLGAAEDYAKNKIKRYQIARILAENENSKILTYEDYVKNEETLYAKEVINFIDKNLVKFIEPSYVCISRSDKSGSTCTGVRR